MHHTSQPRDVLAWLRERALDFLRGPVNDLHMDRPEPAFGNPLWGVAAGGDPLWEQFKGEAVGPFHWTPAEAFALAFPQETALPEALSVVVWALPQTEATRRDNRRERLCAGERWAKSRILGEPEVNNGLRAFLAGELNRAGIPALAPLLLPAWRREMSATYGYASTWSERHAAYAAGLGTFGLSDGLITAAGKAVRFGSLILRLALPPTPRPYTSYREYCLHFQDGSCGACARRCPVGSVSPQGRDKTLCAAHLRERCAPCARQRWNLDGYGCGLCQTAVPCESGIPRRKAEEAGLPLKRPCPAEGRR